MPVQNRDIIVADIPQEVTRLFRANTKHVFYQPVPRLARALEPCDDCFNIGELSRLDDVLRPRVVEPVASLPECPRECPA